MAIQIKNLAFQWQNRPDTKLEIDHLTIDKGERCFIEGESGSGKSTLLTLLSGVLQPNQGEISLLETDICQLTNRQKDRFRSDHLGIIFQQFNLLPYLSAFQNIQLALSVSDQRQLREGINRTNLKQKIDELAFSLGLEPTLLNQSAGQLSIGQQQRVAAARALIGKPEILIADEPTSALDTKNCDRFIESLFLTAQTFDTTIVFVSHDKRLKSNFERQLEMQSFAPLRQEEG